MRKNLMILVVLIASIAIFNSCGDETATDEKTSENKEVTENKTDDSKSVCDYILNSKEGIFRGYSFVEDITKVKSNEDKNFLKEDTEDFLSYEYKIDNDNSFDLEFKFDEKGLYEISLVTAFAKENAENLLKKIKEIYTPICVNITDKDSFLTMDDKDGKYVVDIDYFELENGKLSVKFEAI